MARIITSLSRDVSPVSKEVLLCAWKSCRLGTVTAHRLRRMDFDTEADGAEGVVIATNFKNSPPTAAVLKEAMAKAGVSSVVEADIERAGHTAK